LRTADRSFTVAGMVAGLFLVGFVTYVAVSSSGGHGGTGDPGGISTGATFPPESPPPSLAVGATAPGFSLPRLGGGPPVALTSYAGTGVIVSFFASWCSHCRAELSAFAEVAHQQGGRVAVVGVDTSDTSAAEAARLLAAVHAGYPVGVDSAARVATQYKLDALPATYFIDRQGRVVGTAFGQLDVAQLDRWVGRLAPAGPS
jgi:peroxiredoxin